MYPTSTDIASSSSRPRHFKMAKSNANPAPGPSISGTTDSVTTAPGPTVPGLTVDDSAVGLPGEDQNTIQDSITDNITGSLDHVKLQDEDKPTDGTITDKASISPLLALPGGKFVFAKVSPKSLC